MAIAINLKSTFPADMAVKVLFSYTKKRDWRVANPFRETEIRA